MKSIQARQWRIVIHFATVDDILNVNIYFAFFMTSSLNIQERERICDNMNVRENEKDKESKGETIIIMSFFYCVSCLSTSY